MGDLQVGIGRLNYVCQVTLKKALRMHINSIGLSTPIYRKDTGKLRMVYFNFHKPVCPRDFSMTIFIFLVGVQGT